tara:strand:- start:176911 stop:177636 length:726 start_codon:yes stop_codon:yes gene_type:complete
MEKQALLYSGKAKSIYKTNDENLFVMEYRNDATAFNGVKKAELSRKGLVNNYFNAFIMEKLEQAGIKTHFEKRLSDNESLVKNLTMLPVECVVRNIAAGGMSKRLGIEEGTELPEPVFEFFLKNDELDDPMVNDSHITVFGWATEVDIAAMKRLTFAINDILKPLFADADFLLVDYKLEFGLCNGELLLGDEFTPDGCRLWDAKTKEKFDKDRFRRDLGDVIGHYEQAAARLGIQLPEVGA